jgi:hypothetical protein
LRSLAKRDGGDHLVLKGVDGSGGVIVLKPDIESRPVAGWPEAMWQRASGDGGYLLERIGTEDLYRVEAAYRDVGELPTCIANDVDVIGDRSGIAKPDRSAAEGLEQLRRENAKLKMEIEILKKRPSTSRGKRSEVRLRREESTAVRRAGPVRGAAGFAQRVLRCAAPRSQ